MNTQPNQKGSENSIIVDLQNTVSASRLGLFLQCRLKFFFRYVAQIQKPKTAALHLGSCVHEALKLTNKARWIGKPLTPEEALECFRKAWGESNDINWEPGEEDEEKAMGSKLLVAYLQQVSPDTKPDAVEVPVEADLKSHGLPRLIGILDLVQDGKVIDYKTSASTPNQEKIGHLNEVQLTSYSLLYRQNTDQRENGLELHHLIKTKTPKVVITELPPMTESQLNRLFRLMDSYIKGLDRRDFVPSCGLHCYSCEFFNECRKWR